jgi:hypothetical protein
MRLTRREVCWASTPWIASVEGSSPPGKMYLWIQVKVLRVATIRWCSIRIAWIAAFPPGARSESMVWKYVGQYFSPTASIISTLTIASNSPVWSR